MQFPEKTIFTQFDWILQRGSRVAIVGVNGAGKTTLLKALAQGMPGSLPLTAGTLKLGHQVQVGYYSQMQAESLHLEWTILQELEVTAPKLELAQVRAIAGAFLFTGEDVYKKIKVLSGGEKARVALAKLLLTPNNFLLLDEPTNHLDAESREVLLQALMDYQGTLVLVSHDRDFVSPLVDQLLEIKDRKIIPLVISYEEYLATKVQETRERMRKPRGDSLAKLDPERPQTTHPKSESGASDSNQKSPSRAAQKNAVSNNQKRAWEKEFKETEAAIVTLESRQSELNDLIAKEVSPEQQDELKKYIDEQVKNQMVLNEKLARWEELGSLLGS